MELEHILAEAYEQEHWAKSPDLRHLMTELAGDGFNDAMRAAIDAKRGICEMLSLDEHGRRFFSAPPAAMTEVVANLPESSWIIEAYWSLTNGIYAHVSSRGADQFRHGVAIYDWATASHQVMFPRRARV
jgi:hypothetical protein